MIKQKAGEKYFHIPCPIHSTIKERKSKKAL